MRKTITLLGAALAGLLLVYWLANDETTLQEAESPAMIEVPVDTPQTASQPKPAEANTVNVRGFPLSLDNNGALIPTPAIRQLFDQIAREHGETPVSQWKGNVLSQSKDALSPAAFEQLESMLNHYVEYNLALQLLPMEGPPGLSEALERVERLRKDYLGLTNAEGMFSDWVQLEQFSKDYLDLMLSEKNPIEVQHQLEEKIQTLPSTVQSRAQNVLDQSQELLSTLAVAVADPDGFKALAEQTAASALIQPNFTFAEPDPDFMRRYKEYQATREKLTQENPSPEKQAEALQHLAKSCFPAPNYCALKPWIGPRVFNPPRERRAVNR